MKKSIFLFWLVFYFILPFGCSYVIITDTILDNNQCFPILFSVNQIDQSFPISITPNFAFNVSVINNNSTQCSCSSAPSSSPICFLQKNCSFVSMRSDLFWDCGALYPAGKSFLFYSPLSLEYTYSFWVFPGNITENFRSLFQHGNNFSSRMPGVWLRANDNRIFFSVSTTYFWNEYCISNQALSASEWTHVALRISGNVEEIFVSGLTDATCNFTGIPILQRETFYIAGKENFSRRVFVFSSISNFFHFFPRFWCRLYCQWQSCWNSIFSLRSLRFAN